MFGDVGESGDGTWDLQTTGIWAPEVMSGHHRIF